MGVKYDVIFKDGQRMTREAVCFGSMAGANWTFGNHELSNRPADQQSMIQFYTANNIHPIWEEPNYMANRREWSNRNNPGQSRRDANRAYLTEMAELIADLPWLQDVITIHPLVGVVRAHIKTHAADKIITSLMLMRNLCNYGETAASYRHFKQAGYRPRFCAIMAHIVTKNFGAMGRMDFNGQYLGEYNWINPQTFGKRALLQMMSADKDTAFDFIQLPWSVQKGYRRDGFYRYPADGNMSAPMLENSYEPDRGGWLVFDPRYISAETWDYTRNQAVNPRSGTTRGNGSYLLTRNVVDCYSIPGDEPVGDTQNWNPVHGFSYKRPEGVSSQDAVQAFVDQIESVCTEAGISIRQ